jgi:hypothetical protein
MLNKLDLELFQILESEIDKTLNKWCFYKRNWNICEIDNGDIKNESISIWLHFQAFMNNVKIIWHYPTTNTVLRYIKNDTNIWYPKMIASWWNNENIELLFHRGTTPYDSHHMKLDITKEIKKYTNEQKQELINFLKNV